MTKQEIDNLITENHNLIYFCLNKWKMPIDEYYDVAAIGLCRAAQTYDSTRTKFSTYACACIYNQLKYTLRTQGAGNRIPPHKQVSFEQELSSSPDNDITFFDLVASSNSAESVVLSRIFVDKVLSLLSDKDKTILHLTISGYIQSEIGKQVGISQTSVSRALNRIGRIIKRAGLV